MWLGPGPVAEVLGLHPKTVARLIDEEAFGKGESRRTPKGHRRVRLSAVQAYLAAKAGEVAA